MQGLVLRAHRLLHSITGDETLIANEYYQMILHFMIIQTPMNIRPWSILAPELTDPFLNISYGTVSQTAVQEWTVVRQWYRFSQDHTLNLSNLETSQIWTNVWDIKHLPTAVNKWYCLLHDILPTQASLYKRHMVQSDHCQVRNMPDNIFHYITKCNRDVRILLYVKGIINQIVQCTSPHYFVTDILLRPHQVLHQIQTESAHLVISGFVTLH